MSKLASIGLPTFNGAKYVRRALDSLAAQTYKNIEVIISDDASDDDTFQICESYAKIFPRMKLFRNERRGGYVNNFYNVLKEASGEYFMWAGQDDWWHPEYVEVLAGKLDANPEYGLALSSFQYMYEDGVVKQEILFNGEKDITSHNFYRNYMDALTVRNIHPSQVPYGLFRRNLLARCLKRPLAERKAWDKIFVSEMALAARFITVDRVLRFADTRKFSGKVEADMSKIYSGIPAPPKNAFWLIEPKFFKSTHTNIFVTSIARAFRSPIIPFHRKLLAPLPWLAAAWVRRRPLASSIWADIIRYISGNQV